jgi:hypothetical protein
MKTWLKNILRSHSQKKEAFLEELKRIYGHFRTFLRSREKALGLLNGPDGPPFDELAEHLKTVIDSLNLFSKECSLDLVRRFQELETRLRNPGGLSWIEWTASSGFPFTCPGAGPFSEKTVQGLPDLLDYTHELAIEAMFDLLDRFDPSWSKAPKVQTGLPINLHVIDLGGGLFSEAGKKVVRKEEILCEPLKAMFKGMYYPGITWSGPIGVNLKGLMVIMAQSTSRPEEDFWDKTYALLSGSYMNYNSRLGYHYNSVDAYLGDTAINNHIRFMFKGGAADDIRRNRRARFIGAVLEHLGFEVVIQKDLVDARFLRSSREATEKNLDLIGRLMGCSRQRDMVMNDEAVVTWHIEAFLRGNYGFDPSINNKEKELQG